MLSYLAKAFCFSRTYKLFVKNVLFLTLVSSRLHSHCRIWLWPFQMESRLQYNSTVGMNFYIENSKKTVAKYWTWSLFVRVSLRRIPRWSCGHWVLWVYKCNICFTITQYDIKVIVLHHCGLCVLSTWTLWLPDSFKIWEVYCARDIRGFYPTLKTYRIFCSRTM